MSALVLQTAKRHVKHFVDESNVMRDHHEAMDCFDCQAFLQLGIDTYDWIVRADQVIRSAELSSQMEYDPSTHQTIDGFGGAFSERLSPMA